MCTPLPSAKTPTGLRAMDVQDGVMGELASPFAESKAGGLGGQGKLKKEGDYDWKKKADLKTQERSQPDARRSWIVKTH